MTYHLFHSCLWRKENNMIFGWKGPETWRAERGKGSFLFSHWMAARNLYSFTQTEILILRTKSIIPRDQPPTVEKHLKMF